MGPPAESAQQSLQLLETPLPPQQLRQKHACKAAQSSREAGFEHARKDDGLTSNTAPRMFSSAMTPSLVAHWKAAMQESLISFRYCTPLVTSVSRLGPVVSGPKHQIFLARSLSQPNSSARILERILGSSRGPTLPSSIASARPSSMGRACCSAIKCQCSQVATRVKIRFSFQSSP